VSTPSEAPEVQVPDDPYVWLAIHAEAYTIADRALWRFKSGVEVVDGSWGSQNKAHLENLREKRKEAYQTLVGSVMTCEAIRLGAKP
jgi:ribosome biogenesis protein Tsr3